MKYHYIDVVFVMRDCDDAGHAKAQLQYLLPRFPDETTMHIESWEIKDGVRSSDNPVFPGFTECSHCGTQYRNVPVSITAPFVCGECTRRFPKY